MHTAPKPHVASSQLLRLINSERKGRLWLIKPTGNFGDVIIHLGAEALLTRNGIPFETVRHDQVVDAEFAADDCIYLHGGGGWVPFWSGTLMRAFAHILTRHAGIVIVGPSTFSADADFLDKVLCQPLRDSRAKVYVFCREQPSLDALRNTIGNLAQVSLDHDTAFNLTREDLFQAGDPVGPGRGYRLYALRNDAESRPIGACRLLRAPVDPVEYCYSFKHWVRLHARAESILTNRLHSAICGAILGVPTTLLPNSYHKARGVWEYSLRERGVQWAEGLPPDWLGRVEERIGINRYWRGNRNLQRLIGRYRFGSSR